MTDRNRSGVPTSSGGSTNSRPSSKVARLIEEYGLDPTFGDRLEELWTADGDERESLRSLADIFNKRLLIAAIEAAGATTLDGEIENLYRLLTDDDVSSGQRAEAHTRVQQEGVDVEQLGRDFVTYQAIRSYLKEYRGADYEAPSPESRVEGVTETVQRLTARARSVAENSLDQLRATSALSLGDFRVFVEINVLCEDCNSQYGIVELLDQGGCDCDQE